MLPSSSELINYVQVWYLTDQSDETVKLAPNPTIPIMVEASSSEISVSIYNKQCQSPEDHILNNLCCKNLKMYTQFGLKTRNQYQSKRTLFIAHKSLICLDEQNVLT
jgi:hypothetical protein